jgi:hypothetical protein
MWHGLQLNTADTVRAGGSAKELHHCGGDAAAERRRVVAGIDAAPARAEMPNLWLEVRLADGAVWSCTWLTAPLLLHKAGIRGVILRHEATAATVSVLHHWLPLLRNKTMEECQSPAPSRQPWRLGTAVSYHFARDGCVGYQWAINRKILARVSHLH